METLVLPKQYVELQEDEMMYLDGEGVGKHWWNSTGFIGTVLEVGLIAVTGGISFFSAKAAVQMIKNHRGTITRMLRKELIKRLGYGAAGLVSSAIDITLAIGGTSVGAMLALGLDLADGTHDGYILA